MSRLKLTLLGGFEARSESGASLSIPATKSQALLAYLALHPGQACRRDTLMALLWGDATDRQARHSLSQSLFALRRALAPCGSCLVVHDKTLALDASAVEVDVARFELLLSDGAPPALEEAAALYTGDLLEGLDVDEAPFEEWLLAERERVRERALEALARLLADQMKHDLVADAIQTAVRLVAFDPLQEAVHRTLMRLYVRQGRRASALRQYQVCVGILQRELSVEPEQETRQLYQEILQQRPTGPVTLAVELTRLPRDTPLIGRATELRP